MIYYFTGTGNSLWAAREAGKKLQQPVESIMKYREKAQVVCQDKAVGFVFPTYMVDVPWIAKEFLLKLKVEKDAYTFAIMTSSNGSSGKSFESINQGLAVHGGQLMAGFDLQMPGNCIESSVKENEKRLKDAPEAMEQILAAVSEGKSNFTGKKAAAGENFVESSYFYGEHSVKRLSFMKKFIITESCDGCGICASVCPTENISIKDGKAVHGGKCAACYGCLHWCPKNATLLNVPALKHRKQYHHPEVSLADVRLRDGGK